MHLGIDLGGTKTEIIALDQSNTEHWRKRVPSPQGNYSDTIQTIKQLVDEAAERFGRGLTLGLGIPGAIDPESARVKNANSTWLIGEGIEHDLKGALRHLHLKNIKVANDADCFALSESVDGAGKDFQCVFGVILGTGVGGGLVYNKQPLCGPNAITGEWGHNPLPVFNPSQALDIWSTQKATHCYCGNQNCIETFLSGPGMALNFAKSHPHLPPLSSHEIISAYRDKEGYAESFLATYVDWLARALSGVVNIVDPDVIVLGGGLSNVDELYTLLPNALPPYVFSDTTKTPIKKAKHGDSSGVRGAAWLGASGEI